MSRGEMIKGHTTTLLLSALADGPLHGYAIARKIEELSEGYFDLNEGSLYPALHALEREGAVTATWEQHGGRRRRRYRITPKGRRRLAELLQEWEEFATAVGRVLGVAAHA